MRRAALGTILAIFGLAAAAAALAAQAGPAPAPAAPATAAAAPGPGVRPLALDVEGLRKALAGVPVLAGLAPRFEPFSTADVDAALRRGGRSRESIHVWTIMPAAFRWSPRAGRELLVLSGRSGARALIAVLEVKPGQAFGHAASLTLHEPEATLAVGYSDQYPDQLVWSSCYGCAGEGGTVRWLEDGRVEFGYR
jgi:hypothetical protein